MLIVCCIYCSPGHPHNQQSSWVSIHRARRHKSDGCCVSAAWTEHQHSRDQKHHRAAVQLFNCQPATDAAAACCASHTQHTQHSTHSTYSHEQSNACTAHSTIDQFSHHAPRLYPYCRYGPRQSERRFGFSDRGRLACEVNYVSLAQKARGKQAQVSWAGHRVLCCLNVVP